MKKRGYRVDRSMNLGGGVLYLLHEKVSQSSLGPLPRLASIIIYDSDRKRTLVSNLDDLAMLLKDNKIDVNKYVDGNELFLAGILALLLDIGWVITPSDQEFVVRAFNTDIEVDHPHVDQNKLRFLSSKLDLLDRGPLIDASVDLTTLEYALRVVAQWQG